MVDRYLSKVTVEEYDREFLDATRLVDIEVAAKILYVSTSTVKRRVAEGLLATYSDTPDRANHRFLASELREYVRRMRTIHRER